LRAKRDNFSIIESQPTLSPPTALPLPEGCLLPRRSPVRRRGPWSRQRRGKGPREASGAGYSSPLFTHR
jgi:hypothetical protein